MYRVRQKRLWNNTTPPADTINLYQRFHSAHLPIAVLLDTQLSVGARLLYADLTAYAGRNGRCFPYRKQLALDLGCSVDTIGRWIKELKKAKYITVRKQQRGGCVYFFLNHPRLQSCARNNAAELPKQLSIPATMPERKPPILARLPVSKPAAVPVAFKEEYGSKNMVHRSSSSSPSPCRRQPEEEEEANFPIPADEEQLRLSRWLQADRGSTQPPDQSMVIAILHAMPGWSANSIIAGFHQNAVDRARKQPRSYAWYVTTAASMFARFDNPKQPAQVCVVCGMALSPEQELKGKCKACTLESARDEEWGLSETELSPDELIEKQANQETLHRLVQESKWDAEQAEFAIRIDSIFDQLSIQDQRFTLDQLQIGKPPAVIWRELLSDHDYMLRHDF